jgi:hypothetical protein
MKVSSLRMAVLLPAVILVFGSCGQSGSKRLNRRVSLSRHDDKPYGARIAYEALPHIFPDAELIVHSNSSPFVLTESGDMKRAFIVIAGSFVADSSDVVSLMTFIEQGNQVFISANHISENLLNSLSVRASVWRSFSYEPDSLTVGVYSPVDSRYLSYSYPGDAFDSWVTKLDTQYTSVLGRAANGRPNFIRLTYKGGGAIFLHFAPLAFSNFFLLHKQNMAYYENSLSYLSPNIKQVIWDEYYRYEHGGGSGAFSTLQHMLNFIFGNGPLTWGFWLLLTLLLIIYLFESKRRQRRIPVIPPLTNTSLEFVQTIGRLYFQRRDNHNLATKMAAHFLDQVRTRHRLTATALDDEQFVDRLSYRTGYPKDVLAPLVARLQELPQRGYLSDEELMELHRGLEAFYKHT